MSDRLYLCLECRDVGLVFRHRFAANGRNLGTFASPCPECGKGEDNRRDWTDNGLRAAAERNEQSIARLDEVASGDEPTAELARWRSAQRARQDHADQRDGRMRALGERA